MRKNKTLDERFLNKIFKDINSGCWIWEGRRNIGGYGIVYFKYKHFLAHRVSWEVYNGSIPEGLCVCHNCDNPSCVNPYHLFIGTRADNNKDKTIKGRCYHPINQSGENSSTAKLNNDTVRKIRAEHCGRNGKILANKYGVCQATISEIINNKKWIGV